MIVYRGLSARCCGAILTAVCTLGGCTAADCRGEELDVGVNAAS